MKRKMMKNWRRGIVLWLALLATVLCMGGCGTRKEAVQGGSGGAGQSGAGSTVQETQLQAEQEPERQPQSQQEPQEQPREQEPQSGQETVEESEAEALDPSGSYTSCEEVALYLQTYGKLPGNFITKAKAKELGWEGGSLEPYAPGMCIGGDKFGNYEGKLPKAKGRTYHECDIDTLGAKSRGAKRIVYSNDGLIYYTKDHYENFVLLYGDAED